ncbi:WD40-repeat-containing domain protein [Spinellus fusiger]|nr:WD40-repeat-containing domain protein [Spinellus fusiger]
MNLVGSEDISPPATPPSTSPSPQLAAIFDDHELNHLFQLKTSFQQLTSQQRHFLLYEIIHCCDNSQLSYLSNLIAPRLKVDFLKELPIEISLHILSFIDDPKTMGRVAYVSTFWNSLLRDEATWKALCMKHHYRRRNSSICEYFKRKYNIASAWAHGGRVKVIEEGFSDGLVTSLQFDEKYIVIGCDNHRIEVFDTRTGKKVRSLEGHEGGVWALQFKGGDKRDPERVLVSGGCDRDVRVWDLDTGNQRYVLHGHTSTVRCLKMKDKRTVVTGSRDTTLRVWDIKRGILLHALIGHQASVRCLDIAGNMIVSGSYDSTARIWDLQSGRCRHTLVGHYSQIYAIATDGYKVVSGSLDSHIRVWSVETGQCLATLHGHTSLVGQLQLSSTTLVSGGSDGCLRVWDLQSYECIQQISAHDNSVTCLQFDDRRMLSAGNDGKIKLWDIRQGRLIRSFTQPAKTVWKIQFSDTKAVVVMQRQRSSDTEEGKTVMEIHDFDVLEVPPETLDMDMLMSTPDSYFM